MVGSASLTASPLTSIVRPITRYSPTHLNHNQIFRQNIAVRAVTVNFAVDWVYLLAVLYYPA